MFLHWWLRLLWLFLLLHLRKLSLLPQRLQVALPVQVLQPLAQSVLCLQPRSQSWLAWLQLPWLLLAIVLLVLQVRSLNN